MEEEKKKVLIVVDVQNDFVTGSLGTPEAQAIIPNVKEKFDEYKNNGDYVILTKDTHHSDYADTSEGRKLPEHCMYGTKGWEIVDELDYKNLDSFMVCCKSTFGFDDWDWEEVKDKVMYEIVLAKFTQNPDLKEKLLATGDEHLEEGNTWGDTTWGTVNGIGENRLGIILMKVRKELQEESK